MNEWVEEMVNEGVDKGERTMGERGVRGRTEGERSGRGRVVSRGHVRIYDTPESMGISKTHICTVKC